ncbi:hypothetical protein GTP91_24625 [Rugamonas sp. FT82W]|uniref:Teneurin-like YD-shell domain-containing protein n=2 Tax=Duganella vulcania TaxID=2692166 RepID=A0A845G7S9_9BURK|nr:RHS repeat-associated core domain-containing protein [Duganella vulcania]MYM90344.1 hypothetical protein [Duganella vulcania]
MASQTGGGKPAKDTKYVYLNRHVLAEIEVGGATTVSYDHTDALGSPIAKTNAAGARTALTKYEPYGMTLAGSTTPTIGFTGHVNDADTGHTYMQQRYYDPVAGRFLSMDPELTDAKTGGGFNRYNYANNNPYGNVDPDGRQTQAAVPVVGGILLIGGYKYATDPKARDAINRMLAAIGSHSEPKKNDSKDTPKPDGTKSDAPEAPVPDATGGERVGKGPRIWNKPSDDPVGEANRDFDRKFPGGENVDDKGNGIRVGTLPDGKRVIVRPESSDRSGNLPTIEIQNAGGTKSLDKIRYPQR